MMHMKYILAEIGKQNLENMNESLNWNRIGDLQFTSPILKPRNYNDIDTNQ